MATTEDIDEAEQLRCLALKSMVKRSIKKNSKIKSDESDDNDILLLRAAALKTIAHKKNTKKRSLIDKDNKLIKNKLLRGRKRTSSKKVLKMKNKMKSIESKNKFINNNNNNNTNTKLSIEDLKYNSEIKKEDQLKFKPKTETIIDPTVDINEDVKKIVRNGSIQLSNLDSDKYNETMVLHITFSSSESEDSSSDSIKSFSDSTKSNNNALKNIPQVTSLATIMSPNTETDIESKTNRLKYLMQKLVELMQHCETDVKNRDQQIRIFLEAYNKYQNYNQSLYSTLVSLQEVRDELASVSSLDLKTTNS
ncbi:Hypothetical protein CINCED_3A024020 [Cinara cedri]|uniref:Uncharacterized protein n=1 Tax=Cinara cedri TaxID=506608 RepID=A0A5E4NAE1_9HEMI|nr:Hypothetical protein CINCED_3A024020 [Cinara cedri]